MSWREVRSGHFPVHPSCGISPAWEISVRSGLRINACTSLPLLPASRKHALPLCCNPVRLGLSSGIGQRRPTASFRSARPAGARLDARPPGKSSTHKASPDSDDRGSSGFGQVGTRHDLRRLQGRIADRKPALDEIHQAGLKIVTFHFGKWVQSSRTGNRRSPKPSREKPSKAGFRLRPSLGCLKLLPISRTAKPRIPATAKGTSALSALLPSLIHAGIRGRTRGLRIPVQAMRVERRPAGPTKPGGGSGLPAPPRAKIPLHA